MIDHYYTVAQTGTGEIVEKKSRFIATIREVHTEEEATTFVTETKKKYWDARHNCSAWILGKTGEQMHSSDDGEPSGTAGKPMLEVLKGANLCDVAVVVTRYFGGTLLGTGGLVRAYTSAVKEGLRDCGITKRVLSSITKFTLEYQNLGKLQYQLAIKETPVLQTEYADKVILTAAIEQNILETLLTDIKIATNNQIQAEDIKNCYASVVDGKIFLYEMDGSIVS